VKLLFRQRFFSWFSTYDIYDEKERVVYTVKGQLSWGHAFAVLDASGSEVARLKEKIFAWKPTYKLTVAGAPFGTLQREFTFFKPRYTVAERGWTVQGNFSQWSYTVSDARGNVIASMNKQLWKWTDAYVIDVKNPADALTVLMIAAAIDADKQRAAVTVGFAID